MRIQHNISAMNSYRQMGTNNNMLSKNLEKLSSGYRINRAGDDAAGLAISEKMRSQIKGLETAQKNANDGISLVQTAEGALTEVHSMLNRMTELATQSANGTYDDKVDRANLQKEVSALLDEIDRIAESTNFNGINLLDGSLSSSPAPSVSVISSAQGAKPTEVVGKGTTFTGGEVTAGNQGQAKDYYVKYKDADGKSHEVKVSYTSTGTAADDAELIAKELSKDAGLASLFDIKADTTNKKVVLTTKQQGAIIQDPNNADDTNMANVPEVTHMGSDKAANGEVPPTPTKGQFNGTMLSKGLQAGDQIEIDGKVYTIASANAKNDPDAGIFKSEGELIKHLEKNGYMVVKGTAGAVDHTARMNTFENGVIVRVNEQAAPLNLQIGDTADGFNQLDLSIGNMSADALGIGTINIGTKDGAEQAIGRIKEAINKVSSTRGDLGAVQNRLEHTINNLGVTTENLTAAESRIRDTDMASEMMAYTKNNILIQASQAMLAQANQVPQGVLQLLQ